MRYKYPRTFHLPWSSGTSDDKILSSTDIFKGKEVVVTEKMDGENTSIYNDYFHARSLDGSHHPSQSYVKSLAYEIGYKIQDGYRICGENLFAKHSIKYENLESYFLAFSVWNNDECLSWKDTKEFCKSLNIKTVPVLYEGIYDEKIIKALHNDDNKEGYVVRVKDAFNYKNFKDSVAKFVRANHVQTDSHWKSSKIVKNNLTKS